MDLVLGNDMIAIHKSPNISIDGVFLPTTLFDIPTLFIVVIRGICLGDPMDYLYIYIAYYSL